MLKYQISGGDLPVVTCYLDANQTIKTEKGAMCWMSPNMRMSTNAKGGAGGILGRVVTGESIFMNEYTAVDGPGMIAMASSFPGSIIPFHLTPGNDVVVQKRGFLAMEDGMQMTVAFQKKVGAGLFGGEGFLMQRISGNGVAFVEIDGSVTEIELKDGEQLIVDTGYLAAYTGNCKMDVQTVKGLGNVLFGGEGLFNTVITGPGKVYLQSMPIYGLAATLGPYRTT